MALKANKVFLYDFFIKNLGVYTKYSNKTFSKRTNTIII